MNTLFFFKHVVSGTRLIYCYKIEGFTTARNITLLIVLPSTKKIEFSHFDILFMMAFYEDVYL